MWLVSHATGWSDRSGRSGDTMRWVREVIAGRFANARGNRSGRVCPEVGLLGATWGESVVDFGTLRRYHPSARIGAAAQMGSSDDTMICEKAALCTRVQVGTFGTL